MANYLEMARRALAAIRVPTEVDTPDETEAEVRSGALLTEAPPVNEWPQSLSELAAEVGQRSGDTEAARRDVWLDWCEWKAAALNRLFQEQGATGQPGRITGATVRHGESKRYGPFDPMKGRTS
jgi:hypothetical protein